MSNLTDRIEALEARAMESPDGLLPDDDMDTLAFLYATYYGDTPKVCLARRGSA